GMRPGWTAPGRRAPFAAHAGHRDAASRSETGRHRPGASSPRSGHHRALREGRLGNAAVDRPALARRQVMSALANAAADYLRLRNRLGHQLAEYHRLLPRFVAFLDDAGLETGTVAAAWAWVNAPDVDASSTVASHRMTIARGFARHMAGLDPRTEIPPFGLVGSRRYRHEPFIFSPDDIAALVTGAQSLRTRFASATHETLIGLLAATGMRVGEAIRLDRGDVAATDATLTIRESKFGKSRMVPLQPSVLAALHRDARLRDDIRREPTTVSFFVSTRGNRMVYQTIHAVFRNLCDSAGIGADATSP